MWRIQAKNETVKNCDVLGFPHLLFFFFFGPVNNNRKFTVVFELYVEHREI